MGVPASYDISFWCQIELCCGSLQYYNLCSGHGSLGYIPIKKKTNSSTTALHTMPYIPFTILPLRSSCQAPYRWRHATLEDVRKDLKQMVKDGTYRPILTTGLDWV